MSVARCRRISNVRYDSDVSMPKSECAIAKCPELETGRNSVSPCMIPQTIASSKVKMPSYSAKLSWILRAPNRLAA